MQRGDFRGFAHHERALPRSGQDAFDLGVARLPHDDDLVALGGEFGGGVVRLLHMGAGGIDYAQAASMGTFDDLRYHAVAANDHRARRLHLVDVGHRGHATLSEALYDAGVVDERTEGAHARMLG